MGRTPGHLSSAIRQQTVKADSPSRSTCWVQMHRARSAKAWQISVEADLKLVQMCLQAVVSRLEGPADPLYRSVAIQIVELVMLSKRMGWVSGARSVLVNRGC